MESGQAASQMSSWLESGYGLFLVIHFVGLALFWLHRLAPPGSPTSRAARLSFRPSPCPARQGSEVLVRTVEASALQDRRHSSHPHLYRVHPPSHPFVFHPACRCFQQCPFAGFSGNSGAHVRCHHGLRRHRSLPLHVGRHHSPSDLPARTLCSSREIREGTHRGRHFPARA